MAAVTSNALETRRASCAARHDTSAACSRSKVASRSRSPQKSQREPSFTFTSTSPRRSDASTAATSPSGNGSRCGGSHSPAAAAPSP